MANIMDQKDLKNKVNRSGFDLSLRNMFSSRTGEIMPVAFFETLPGDKFQIKFSDFMRTQPFMAANFARLRHYVDAYFVPYRLLWDKFPSWILQTKNSYQAKSYNSAAVDFSAQPYFTTASLVDAINLIPSGKNEAGQEFKSSTQRLLDALGYCTTPKSNVSISSTNLGAWNQKLNPFPLLAYQKIYQDYFRFGQWEDAAPWTYNLDYVMQDSQLEIPVSAIAENEMDEINMLQMRYCNLDKDLFNGLLPSAQFGDEAIASPIVGTIAGNIIMESDSRGDGNSFPSYVYNYYDDKMTLADKSDNSIVRLMNNYSHLDIINDRHNSAGISVLAIRMAEQLQKWKEITQSGSPDYKEQLYKHWNVKVSDVMSDRCKYLGGSAENVNINEVVNTNLTADNTANLQGKGQLSQNGYIDFESNEYGIIMLVSHVKPVIEWRNTDILHPALLRSKATDYAIPEFDSIGMQGLQSNVLPWNGTFNNSNQFTPKAVKPLGFAPRYIDYKTNYDRINGYFLTGQGETWALAHNPLTEYLDETGYINPNSFRVRPEMTDNLFVGKTAVVETPDADPYLHSTMIDCKVVRNLSYDGLPY